MAKLGEQSVGSIVKLNVNGTARNFIVVHQGLPSSAYDSSCNGTWLLMQDIYNTSIWDSSSSDYENSDIHAYLNNTFINLFDDSVREAIVQAKIPYTKGAGVNGSVLSGQNGLSAKLFLLSAKEVGGDVTNQSSYHQEGAVLEYFKESAKSKRIAQLNGTDEKWWLRTPVTRNTNEAWYVNAYGLIYWGSVGQDQNFVTYSRGVRPALMLPLDLSVDDAGNVIAKSFSGFANIGGANKALSGGYVNIGGVWKEISNMYMCINGGTPVTLPSGYTQVDYLESSGTQYIDTGFTPNQDTRVVLKYGGANSSAWVEVLGAGNSVKNPSTNFVLVQSTSNGTMFEYGAEYATGSATSDGTIVDMNKNNFYINGSLVHTFTYSAFTCPYTLRLFDAATQSEDYSRCSGKIYSCQIYDNGTLIRDFVPCQNSAGTAGLYDTVNSKFYTNAGSGTFAVGQTVGADGGIWRQMAK